MAITRDDVRLLRSAGRRVTAVRLAVLEQVGAQPHADVETIFHAVDVQLGSVSRQAVYDALRSLAAANLVRRVEPAGSPARYETRVGDNHHHVVCRICGATADVDCAVGAAPCLEPSELHGFVLDEAEVTFWGLCPRCQQPVAPDSPSNLKERPAIPSPRRDRKK
ncbi:MAG TPA: Fur family transcriptional regulator [Acidimicrobiales bacterium]|nr:Fur family transcriptional regulator [Acidimicrobiales bacterium]